MNSYQLIQLIPYIIDQAQDRGDTVTTIRLVKFLYLIDLEYYRVYRKTLMGLNWIFYRFGPYAFELKEIGDQIGYQLEREEFEAGQKRGIIFRAGQEVNRPIWLEYGAEAVIDRILDTWAGIETDFLLEYVYNRTEPMKNAERGKPLDFVTVPKGSRYFELNIQINLNKGRELLRDFYETMREEALTEISITTSGDEAYYNLVDLLDEDDWTAPLSLDRPAGVDEEQDIILVDI